MSRQLNFAVRVLGFWVAVVSLFFLFQSVEYRGIVAQLAEWQYLEFKRYWPALTFVALTTLFSAPLIIAVWLLRVRQRRDEGLGPARVDDGRIIRSRLGRLQGFFMGMCAGSLLAVVIILILRLQLPSDQGTPRSIVLGSPDAIAPVEGRAVLTGTVDLSETAQYNEDLFLVKRTLYFAPIREATPGPDTAKNEPLRYFVEVRRNDVKGYDAIKFPDQKKLVRVWRFRVPEGAFTPYLQGVLRRRALPGEMMSLYRYAGYDVDSDTYVLFSSPEKLSWHYYVLAGEFGLSALISGIAAIIFGRRKRAVTRRLQEEAGFNTGAAPSPRKSVASTSA
ncbi:hypothetical protein [Sphingobium nicotianae]|uniref:Uncharacterized protein n=1 Tax=Sphingobium nicotianae TaxID=2782607 RepID=A0A9X1D8F8_9SPHN|nr:hypothetical protein [Sphingobium nicotianae]MBT2185359.1 hypothetical protein [Sphingobium nicotianae]